MSLIAAFSNTYFIKYFQLCGVWCEKLASLISLLSVIYAGSFSYSGPQKFWDTFSEGKTKFCNWEKPWNLLGNFRRVKNFPGY